MKRIPLNRGMFAMVDDADFDQVTAAGNWTASAGWSTFYAVRAVRLPSGKRTTQSMHCFLTGQKLIDHADRNGLNNQRANLRPTTTSLNAANAGPFSNNTSGYRGVSWSKKSRKWHAGIKVNQRSISLGYYHDIEEAAAAYDAAALEHFGEFAFLNLERTREAS